MHKFHAFSSRLADASRNFGARAGSFMRALGRDDRGNFAIILAISILPIAAAVGGAVDLNRAFIVQQRLERALDAAGLAVGASPGGTTAEMTAMAQSFFDANYDANELGVPGSVSVVPGDGSFVLTANAELPTTILKVIGLDTLSVGSEIEVVRESKALEIAMVLDNTGSMAWNGKIGALRTAAEDLVSILFGDQDRPSLLRMSLVPFVTLCMRLK